MMQGGRGRAHPFFAFGDPFAGFGGMPSLFEGSDLFDDPFFTNPMDGMLHPSPFMGANPFGSTLLGPTRMFDHMHSLPNASRAPVIEELDSDDEAEPEYRNQKHPHEHGTSSSQSYVEQPYEGRELQQTPYGNQLRVMHDPRSRFTFQSYTVTYGGSNGAYYTSSTTRRDGSDGFRFEEHKEADSVTGQAAHRISRGIHDKMAMWIQCKRCTTSTKMSLLPLKRLGKEKLESIFLAGWVQPMPTMLVLKDLVSRAAGVVVGHCRQLRTWMQVREENQAQLNMLTHQKLGNADKLKKNSNPS